MKCTKTPCLRLFSLNLIGISLHVVIVLAIIGGAIATAQKLNVLQYASWNFPAKSVEQAAGLLLWYICGCFAWVLTLIVLPIGFHDSFLFCFDNGDAKIMTHLAMFGYWICRSVIWVGCLSSKTWYGAAIAFTFEFDLIMVAAAFALIGTIGYLGYWIPKQYIKKAKQELDLV